MKRVAFRVTFDLPEGATIADARSYVADAVSSMKGGLPVPHNDEPGDPMSQLDPNSVSVKVIASASR